MNYKGLLTPWEEPTDAYYMFRSNYVSNKTSPMVYIASHTWPNRWMSPGIKDSINVYSNCDEVELFNDINNASLGKQKRNGIGTHFQWNKVNIQYNVLYAVGYVNGQAVARDTIVLFHLPQSPHFNTLYANAKPITIAQKGYSYLYRVNCGGGDYRDENGNEWTDDEDFFKSWTNQFPELPANFASQRRIFTPIKNTADWKLFQTFRYGKEQLKYEFDVEDGSYLVELYFIEPWLGIGGGTNANGMRVFDVAINNKMLLDDLDVCKAVGTNKVLKIISEVKITGGKMVISFPEIKSGQAIISAIAIAQKDEAANKRSTTRANHLFTSWLDIGDKLYAKENIQINTLPSNLFGADWLQLNTHDNSKMFRYTAADTTDIFFAVQQGIKDNDVLVRYENAQTQIITDEKGGTVYNVFKKRLNTGDSIAYNIHAGIILCRQAVNHMQPAYDLKPVNSYRTNVAAVSGSMQKQNINGRECTAVTDAQQVMVQWPVQIGAADIYSVTVKYYYPKETVLKGRLQLFDAGNNRMMEQEVNFTFTKPGKWNQLTINTGTQINAGNYTVTLVLENGESLAVSGIEIQ